MYQAPRGTQDILPENTAAWRHVERCAEATARPLRLRRDSHADLFEDANLFLRGVGEGTDIVDKEIYRFQGQRRRRSRASVTEGTASPRRCDAYLQHGMSRSGWQPVKVFSLLTVVPRYDIARRPGRYREFPQFNVEAIGDEDPLA